MHGKFAPCPESWQRQKCSGRETTVVSDVTAVSAPAVRRKGAWKQPRRHAARPGARAVAAGHREGTAPSYGHQCRQHFPENFLQERLIYLPNFLSIRPPRNWKRAGKQGDWWFGGKKVYATGAAQISCRTISGHFPSLCVPGLISRARL